MTVQEIKKILDAGNLSEAIDALNGKVPDVPALRAKLNEAKNRRRLGLMPERDYEKEILQVAFALREIIEKI